MCQQKFTKFEIAKQHLEHAIDLFLMDERILSVITLAGAAEEILGRLAKVKDNKKDNALEEDIKLCREMGTILNLQIDEKEFVNLENSARNELKHICYGGDVERDFEQDAINLIERAINNYKLLSSEFNPLFQKFDDKAAAWWHKRINQFFHKID